MEFSVLIKGQSPNREVFLTEPRQTVALDIGIGLEFSFNHSLNTYELLPHPSSILEVNEQPVLKPLPLKTGDRLLIEKSQKITFLALGEPTFVNTPITPIDFG